MATNLTFKDQDENDDHHLIDNLSENRYLKSFVSLSKQNSRSPLPVGLRRSLSNEDISIDINLEEQNNPQLSSSLNSLCVRLRAHQLLPEFNENIAKSSDEHQFDWRNSIAHLRPLIEKIILYEQFTNEFCDDHHKEDQIFYKFAKSKRNGRRNAVCFAIDRLYYNEQTILFVAISNSVQTEYNLMYSGS